MLEGIRILVDQMKWGTPMFEVPDDDPRLLKRVRTVDEVVDYEGERTFVETEREDTVLRPSKKGIDVIITKFATPGAYPCGCPDAGRSFCPVHEHRGSEPWNVVFRVLNRGWQRREKRDEKT